MAALEISAQRCGDEGCSWCRTWESDDETRLLPVSQGITYDTGGADIKAGGHMAGMHRDKCGAAAVAGFFQVRSTELAFVKAVV